MLESGPAADVLHFVRPDTATFDKRTSMKVEQRLDCRIEGAFRWSAPSELAHRYV